MRVLPLAPGQVELWTLSEDAASCASIQERFCGFLTPHEHARRAQLRQPADRARFVAGRALLRWALSRYVARSPQDWRFIIDAHGRPELDGADCDRLSFNLSHTKGMIVCAFARDVRVGVDVEDLRRPVAAQLIADRFFTPTESHALRAAPAQRQQALFFCYWTLKEAFVKANGLGLALSLQSFSFTLPERADGAIGFHSHARNACGPARFWTASISPHHLAAVAVLGAEADRAQLSVHHCIPVQHDTAAALPLAQLAPEEADANASEHCFFHTQRTAANAAHASTTR